MLHDAPLQVDEGCDPAAPPAAHLTYLGLYALQHRGQESAGIAVSDGTKIVIDKDMGLVSTIFDEHRLRALPGGLAIGHTRYATTGASAWRNAQPVAGYASDVFFALGHNGNLVNTAELAGGQVDADCGSDSDVVAALLADSLPGEAGGDLVSALHAVLPRLQGAYSFVAMDETRLIGARDPQGFRPLFLGKRDTGGWVLASESPALDVVGARVIREIDPGELVVLDADGVHSSQFAAPQRRALCSFEFVYIARPDGKLAGVGVNSVRRRMGAALARYLLPWGVVIWQMASGTDWSRCCRWYPAVQKDERPTLMRVNSREGVDND